MGRKKKINPEVKPEVKSFEYGDLAVVCKCGRTQILERGIDKGLQMIITTREDSYIQLRCDECGADMRLCFIEGEAPKKVETATEEVSEMSSKTVDENVQEESKQEQSL